MKFSLKEYLKKPIEINYKCRYIMDQINVQQIHELSKKSKEAAENGDVISEKSYIENIFSKIKTLSPEFKDKFNSGSYSLCLELVRLLINDHQYEEALNHLKIARDMPEYENLDTITKCILNKYICYSKLFLGLSSGSKSLILEAKELNQKLIHNSGKITSGELKKQVLDDKKIIEAWERNDIKTIMEFEIPFPLIVTDQPIEFEYENTKHIIEIEIIQSPLNPMPTSGGFFSEIVEDKYGIARRSKIKLTSFRYINPHEIVELDILAQDKRIQRIFLETIKVMNFFIERYRLVSKKYWLENIFHKMITKYLCTVTAGTFEIHNINMMNNQLVQIQLGVPWLSTEKLEELNDNLKKERLDLWKTLLLDSKDYLLRRNYRESIYAINGALENFLNQKAREILRDALKDEEVEEFFAGKIKYEEHKLKKYMDKDSFEKAIASNAIPTFYPTIYQMISKCHKLVPFPSGKKKINRLISKINKRRNEVAHGNEIQENLEEDAKIAIESFEQLVKLFDN
ncbi:hypothetical protein [Methanobacterium aggregans]|uniref:hypothetical protein n=1 Tax=Methanobacterium aggregans TaxID=1615586 RepID=UPI001AEABE2A|nr:hypothetical protein [Methanobacterium aggregans]MBP2045292.1 hypothetical protein [Methanobacterium aggregans]